MYFKFYDAVSDWYNAMPWHRRFMAKLALNGTASYRVFTKSWIEQFELFLSLYPAMPIFHARLNFIALIYERFKPYPRDPDTLKLVEGVIKDYPQSKGVN